MASSRSFYNNEEIQNYIVVPPDGGWGWFVVFSAFLCFFLIDGAVYCFGIYIELLSHEFDVGIAQTALIGSILTGASYLVGPFVSALLNKYDFRFVSMLGCLTTAASYLGASFCYNYILFTIIYGCGLGIGLGLMYVPSVVMPNLYFVKWRALASALSACGTGAGSFTIPPIITFLLTVMTWRNVFRCYIGMVLLIGLASLTYKPLVPLKAINRKSQADVYLKGRKSIAVTDDDDSDDENDKKSKCCPCCLCRRCRRKCRRCRKSACYENSNKNFPTTAEIIPPKEAILEEDPDIEITGRVTSNSSVASTYTRSRKFSRASARYSQISAAKLNCCETCWYNFVYLICCEPCEHETKPFYRDDIFYSNAIKLMPTYKTHAIAMKKKMKEAKRKKKVKQFALATEARGKTKKPLEIIPELSEEENLKEYHMRVTRVVVQKEFDVKPGIQCCSFSVVRALVTLLHLELFQSPSFVLLCLGGFFFIFGFNVPFMYVVDRGRKAGIDDKITFWFLSAIGASNMLGRLLSGLLPCVININIIILTVVSTIICGCVTICSNLYMETWFQFTFTVIFGISGASMMSLRSVVIVEIFGLENLTNVFGLQLVVCGLAALTGPIAAGCLYDATQTYDYAFYMSGGAIICSAVLLMITKPMRIREMKKKKVEEPVKPTTSQVV